MLHDVFMNDRHGSLARVELSVWGDTICWKYIGWAQESSSELLNSNGKGVGELNSSPAMGILQWHFYFIQNLSIYDNSLISTVDTILSYSLSHLKQKD